MEFNFLNYLFHSMHYSSYYEWDQSSSKLFYLPHSNAIQKETFTRIEHGMKTKYHRNCTKTTKSGGGRFG